MLVLSRKKGERIFVGPDIIVTVLKVNGHTVKLGVEAPGGVQILRAELVHAVPQSDANAGESTRPEGMESVRCDGGGDQGRTNPVRHEICAFVRTPRRWYCAIVLSAHNHRHGRQKA
jgi:carbon storage regulator